MYCLIKVIIYGVSNGLVIKDHGCRYLSKVGGMRIEDGCTGKTTKRIPCSRVMSYFNIVNADKYIFCKPVFGPLIKIIHSIRNYVLSFP